MKSKGIRPDDRRISPRQGKVEAINFLCTHMVVLDMGYKKLSLKEPPAVNLPTQCIFELATPFSHTVHVFCCRLRIWGCSVDIQSHIFKMSS